MPITLPKCYLRAAAGLPFIADKSFTSCGVANSNNWQLMGGSSRSATNAAFSRLIFARSCLRYAQHQKCADNRLRDYGADFGCRGDRIHRHRARMTGI